MRLLPVVLAGGGGKQPFFQKLGEIAPSVSDNMNVHFMDGFIRPDRQSGTA